MMRLDKYLSERLGIPRGESRKLAAKGRVTVNGVLTKKADTQIEEATAEVAVDGRLLAGAYQKYVYLMLNKPEGVVSAAQDKRNIRQNSQYNAPDESSPGNEQDFTIRSAEEARRAIIWGEILQRKY